MYLIKFLIFIFIIIPNSITIETQIKFAFLNGLNVIRCSDNQVQVYEQNENPLSVLSKILTCDNTKSILHNGYAAFSWNELKIVCSSAGQVHEEISIERQVRSHGKDVSNRLPEAEGQLGQSMDSYKLHVNTDNDGPMTVIKSEDQLADDSYFQGNFKRRTIYIWFLDHPIICQITFYGEKNNPCSPETDYTVDDVNYKCYYNPGADEKPTIEEMRAEFKQVEEAEKPADTEIYVLNLDKPKISADNSSISDEDDDDPKNPLNPNSKHPNKKKKLLPTKSPKDKKKSNIGIIVGFILGIVLLLCIIGGIAFYFIQKNRSESLSPSENIETGNNKAAPVPDQNKREQSLPNIEGIKNEISTKDKPNIKLQTTADKKRQRGGTNMVLNDDI